LFTFCFHHHLIK
jgi:hypothetical protein